MIKNKKTIIRDIEEFLEYIARSNENARRTKNLKKKFGEEKYKSIYDIIGGRYTGGLSKEGDIVLYIRDEGLKYLEEREEARREEKRLNFQNNLTMGLFTVAFLQATISIIYYFFDLQIRGFPSQAKIFSISSVIAMVIFFIIAFRKKGQ
jgi:hypothetical protein